MGDHKKPSSKFPKGIGTQYLRNIRDIRPLKSPSIGMGLLGGTKPPRNKVHNTFYGYLKGQGGRAFPEFRNTGPGIG